MSSAKQIHTRMSSYWEIKPLLTAAELGLFDVLNDNEYSCYEVCSLLSTNIEGTEFLLDGLCSTGILNKSVESKYSLSKDYRELFNSQNPDNILYLLDYNIHIWKKWTKLTEFVKQGRSVHIEVESNRTLEGFIRSMDLISRLDDLAIKVADHINLDGVKTIADLGGALGTYTIALLNKKPELKITLMDREFAVPVAKDLLSKAGIADRVKICSGDFINEIIPGINFDLAFLSCVVHMYGREKCRELYTNVYKHIKKGGRLIIREHIMAENHTHPKEGALTTLLMFVSMSSGKCHSFSEMKQDLESSGFSDVSVISEPFSDGTSLVECRVR